MARWRIQSETGNNNFDRYYAGERWNSEEERYKSYTQYTPTIETFIEHWQKADSAEEVKKSLEAALESMRTEDDKGSLLVVACAEGLSNRALTWRRKGIPLKTLPLNGTPRETKEEMMCRLTQLAIDSAKGGN